MQPLITVQQIADFKQMTTNINEAKLITPYVLEAQELDLRSMLGDEFYIALYDDYFSSPSLETYSDLYNGSTYTYQGKTYKHEGIVAVLVNFSYGRYLQNAGVHSTAFGFKRKLNDASESVSESTMARMISQAKSQAVIYQERVKLFLDRNASDYPLWNSCDASNRRKGSVRITSISQRDKACRYCGYNNCRC
jgi:hypothetical protein